MTAVPRAALFAEEPSLIGLGLLLVGVGLYLVSLLPRSLRDGICGLQRGRFPLSAENLSAS